ncbi:hypothetical protein [Roseococcus pinisoli]|uniref:Uncharacterized protein n=1 Tax=Roseococcus pinisoli TaxID=2835040 RepID=A0ABS5QFD5_9PROT|nr:hypothetical protein [Roseococcus pinisoli]MBS7812401.1 hypothetical protein [Roseococcus pinisoli]
MISNRRLGMLGAVLAMPGLAMVRVAEPRVTQGEELPRQRSQESAALLPRPADPNTRASVPGSVRRRLAREAAKAADRANAMAGETS